MRKSILIASFISIPFLFSLLAKNYPEIKGIITINKSTLISAFIGEGQFSIYGYAPSNSQVFLTGFGINETTTAQKNGYFEFSNQFLPIIPSFEPCLYAKDKLGRTSNPVCIPPIPKDKYLNIGPILLPPTISLDKKNYFKGDDVTFSGQSVPNSEIKFSLFVDKKVVVPEVEAYTIPDLKTNTDSKGNYTITLPAARTEKYRVFTQFKKDDQFSPNSNIMKINILPFWMFIVLFLKYLLELFKTRLIEITIISQIIAITVYLLRSRLKPHIIANERAIVLRQKFSLENYKPI